MLRNSISNDNEATRAFLIQDTLKNICSVTTASQPCYNIRQHEGLPNTKGLKLLKGNSGLSLY